ncbi:HAD domain-containing protein [Pseudomonas syringae]|uniref:Uncharacterized protein n=1 Tax=Pseudomonas syringae TaxID=317 RepID=A0A085V9L0_PSESX|nr:HAD domain-containing protein [Pseudomonas syringae]KFE52123.1 hypothetical protein IV02_10220 [Pseudomonas syringae]
MILFLDFDGVLHPDEVYITKTGPKLRSAGELFMWADLLDQLLYDFPAVRIVLSTSWVRHIGFSKAKKRLPLRIQVRVVGSTWHSSMERELSDVIWWDQATRHDQIARYVARSGVTQWVALDDDARGWDAGHLHRLVLTDPAQGLSNPSTLIKLRKRLSPNGP